MIILKTSKQNQLFPQKKDIWKTKQLMPLHGLPGIFTFHFLASEGIGTQLRGMSVCFKYPTAFNKTIVELRKYINAFMVWDVSGTLVSSSHSDLRMN